MHALRRMASINRSIEHLKDLRGAAHATQARENVFHRKAVLLAVLRTHRVFGEDQAEADFPRIARGRFHADVGGNAADDDVFVVGSGGRRGITFKTPPMAPVP